MAKAKLCGRCMERIEPGWEVSDRFGYAHAGTCPKDYHPAATLVGGKVPAHVPGAYPTLSCCGGSRVQLVEASLAENRGDFEGTVAL